MSLVSGDGVTPVVGAVVRHENNGFDIDVWSAIGLCRARNKSSGSTCFTVLAPMDDDSHVAETGFSFRNRISGWK